MDIVIQPVLTGLDDRTLKELIEDIRTELEHIELTDINLVYYPTINQFNRDRAFESAIDMNRDKWNSSLLPDWVIKVSSLKRIV